jgi:hypothetical protein
MNVTLYRRYLQQFINEALQNSDGTNAGIAGYLEGKKVTGFLVQHREEKNRALTDARRAFDEHRHWPTEIVLSHLGVDTQE